GIAMPTSLCHQRAGCGGVACSVFHPYKPSHPTHSERCAGASHSQDQAAHGRDYTYAMATVALLLVSNVFMTFAWYGHLKHRSSPLVAAILVSWLIALGEYCFQ